MAWEARLGFLRKYWGKGGKWGKGRTKTAPRDLTGSKEALFSTVLYESKTLTCVISCHVTL